jgi:hypothetical protein
MNQTVATRNIDQKYCSNCGVLISARAAFCTDCGATQAVQAAAARDIGQDAGMRMLLPVGRSLWAIAAGYLGLLAVTFVLAPFALLTGAIAIYDIRRHPERHGMGRALFGLVMGLLFTSLGLYALISN